MSVWLAFLGDAYGCRWLRLDAGNVVARGDDLAAIAAAMGDADEIIAVVSGTSVVIHWVDLPALAPAQAAAAAQLLAADVCSGRIEATHVVLGGLESGGMRPMAVVDKAMMRDWLATLAAAGLTPDRVVPIPMLVPIDDAIDSEPAAAILSIGDIGHVRGHRMAFSAELPLVDLLLAGQPALPVDQAHFESRLAAQLATAPINLRQGEFAIVRTMPLDRRRLRRIGLLVLAAAGLWLATEVTAVLRDGFAADRVEQQVADAARAALPRGTAIDAPRAQVMERAARLGTAGHGFTALATPLLAAIRDRPALALQALRYTPDSGMVAVVIVPTAAEGPALATVLGSPSAVTVGPARDSDGATVVDVTVRPQ